MATNDEMESTESEYPAMNDVFTRRPVRKLRRIKAQIRNNLCLANQ